MSDSGTSTSSAVTAEPSTIGECAQPGRSPERGNRRLGFESLQEEIQVDRLEICGEIPSWLSGTLVRATPARYEIGDKSLRHWFDGMAMLNAFSFDHGEVAYANRFVDGELERAARTGELRQAMSIGTDPCRRLGQRVMTFFDLEEPPLTTNINVARLGDKYLALTEAPIAVEFDPDTLENKGVLDVREARTEIHAPMAHSHYVDRSMITAVTRVGLRNRLKVISIDGQTQQRHEIASIPQPRRPRYMHSFGITERYVVLTQTPLVISLPRFLATGRFVDGWRYEPTLGSRFVVIDRQTGRLEGVYEAEPFQAFHHINAFERDGEIVVDLVVMDPAHVWALDIEVLRQPDHVHRFYGYAHRYRMKLGGGGQAFGELIAPEQIEFPTIDYGRYNGRPYRYSYAIGYERRDSDWFDEIVKLDVETGEIVRWSEPGCYPSEPIPVRTPDSGAEDDVVVLSVVLDAHDGRSFLLVLDGALREIGRARVPHHIPFNFHQAYFA